MRETWASGALELLQHADSHIILDTAFDQRIAFISVDNAVETALRTFAALPAKLSGSKITRAEIEDAGQSFPKLVELVFKHAGERLVGLDGNDIEHYHRIRNKLYHDGTGLGVDQRYLLAYRKIAEVLLGNLFSVSIKPEVKSSELGDLILLWNEVETTLRAKMLAAGVNLGNTFKWEEAMRAGLLDMKTIEKLTELRMIRNAQVHSQGSELDVKRIALGIALGREILNQLNASS